MVGRMTCFSSLPIACQITFSLVIPLRPFFLLVWVRLQIQMPTRGRKWCEPSVRKRGPFLSCILLLLIKVMVTEIFFIVNTHVSINCIWCGLSDGRKGNKEWWGVWWIKECLPGLKAAAITQLQVFDSCYFGMWARVTRFGIFEKLAEIWINMWTPLLNFASIYSLMSESKY